MQIFVIYGKYDPLFFSSAVAAVRWQLDQTYPYESDVVLMARAMGIVRDADEKGALRLLHERSDIEYERFDVEKVMD